MHCLQRLKQFQLKVIVLIIICTLFDVFFVCLVLTAPRLELAAMAEPSITGLLFFTIL
jgi:hypothetical protein